MITFCNYYSYTLYDKYGSFKILFVSPRGSKNSFIYPKIFIFLYWIVKHNVYVDQLIKLFNKVDE